MDNTYLYLKTFHKIGMICRPVIFFNWQIKFEPLQIFNDLCIDFSGYIEEKHKPNNGHLMLLKTMINNDH
jgi:hypothetical protein